MNRKIHALPLYPYHINPVSHIFQSRIITQTLKPFFMPTGNFTGRLLTNKLHNVKTSVSSWSAPCHQKWRWETALARLRTDYTRLTHSCLMPHLPLFSQRNTFYMITYILVILSMLYCSPYLCIPSAILPFQSSQTVGHSYGISHFLLWQLVLLPQMHTYLSLGLISVKPLTHLLHLYPSLPSPISY